MKVSATNIAKTDGRVLVGPKKVRGGFARIVSCKDGSGCIESFDPVSGTWVTAEHNLTFDEVWGAMSVTPEDWVSISGKY